METFEGDSGLKGPPQATLTRRAKSYSHFYEAAVGYLGRDAEEKPRDILDVVGSGEQNFSFDIRYGQYENDILDASQDEYQCAAHTLPLLIIAKM